MFVQRNGSSQIVGVYRVRQEGYAEEELADNHPDVTAFLNPPPPTIDQLESAALAALNGGGQSIDIVKLLKAKFISDLAFRLGKSPASLTGPELQAERARIANIYKNL